MNQSVFCGSSRMGIIDLAVRREDGVLVGQISKETIEQLALRYPDVTISTMGEAIERQNSAMKSLPVEITEEKFIDMLECLPPIGWISKGNTESFKLSEFTCGRITGIYARIGSRYFHLSDVVSLKHDDIVAKVNEVFHPLQAECH